MVAPDASGRLRIGLVGGWRGGAALLDLILEYPPGVEVIGAGSLRFFWDLLCSSESDFMTGQTLVVDGGAQMN